MNTRPSPAWGRDWRHRPSGEKEEGKPKTVPHLRGEDHSDPFVSLWGSFSISPPEEKGKNSAALLGGRLLLLLSRGGGPARGSIRNIWQKKEGKKGVLTHDGSRRRRSSISSCGSSGKTKTCIAIIARFEKRKETE